MNNLLFLMRVSFICNVCLLLAWVSKLTNFLSDGAVSSTIVVLGIALSSILNLAIHIVLLILIIQKKKLQQFFPSWLLIANFLFLIFQLILFFK